MIIKLLVYLLALLIILMLPERIWEKIWIFFESISAYLKNKRAVSPFFREQKRGEDLLAFLPSLEAKMNMGLKTTNISIPKFKFYTTLLLDLLEVHQKRGMSLRSILPELRFNLTKDLQFEKKLQGSLVGGNLQFFIITLTTWGFIFFSSIIAEIPLKLSDLMIILILQLSGVFSFNVLLAKVKNHTFSKFSQAIERLYLFVGLVEVGLPIGQTLSESKVLEGDLLNHKLFSPCASRLVTLVSRWKENGISPKAESKEVILELWHLKEVSFERFLKHLDALKFIILAFFFLPAYFFYLYSIFQFFMEQ